MTPGDCGLLVTDVGSIALRSVYVYSHKYYQS
jgi:hypothetical protein